MSFPVRYSGNMTAVYITEAMSLHNQSKYNEDKNLMMNIPIDINLDNDS